MVPGSREGGTSAPVMTQWAALTYAVSVLLPGTLLAGMENSFFPFAEFLAPVEQDFSKRSGLL